MQTYRPKRSLLSTQHAPSSPQSCLTQTLIKGSSLNEIHPCLLRCTALGVRLRLQDPGEAGWGAWIKNPQGPLVRNGTSKPSGRGRCWGRPGPSASHGPAAAEGWVEERLLPEAGAGVRGLSVRRRPQVQGVSSGPQQEGATPGPRSLLPETKPWRVTRPRPGTQPRNLQTTPALESRGLLSPTKDSETLKPTHSGAFVSATICPGTCSATQSPVSRNISVTCHFRSL